MSDFNTIAIIGLGYVGLPLWLQWQAATKPNRHFEHA